MVSSTCSLSAAFTSATPLAQNKRNNTCCHNGNFRSGTSQPRRGMMSSRPHSSRSRLVRACYGGGAEGDPLLRSDGTPLLHIVFVSPQIHWNSGNIGRTCLGLGARLHLVGPLGFSLDERQIRRAGLDYWQHVDVHVHETWAEFSATNGPMYALGGSRYFFTKFGSEPAATLDFAASWKRGRSALDQEPVVLLFGSEVDGFTCIQEWLDEGPGRNERRVAFPMVDPRFRSFNLSTTASMALWDAYKALRSAAVLEQVQEEAREPVV